MIKLRAWQVEATKKGINWLIKDRKDKHLLLNVAPGLAKTDTECTITHELFEQNEINRVIVTTSPSEVINQWFKDFNLVTQRPIAKVTGFDDNIEALGLDVCATWPAIQELESGFQDLCTNSPALVICDEHHHAVVKAA